MQSDFRQFMSFKVISSHLFVIKIFCLKKLKIKISPETDVFFRKLNRTNLHYLLNHFLLAKNKLIKGPTYHGAQIPHPPKQLQVTSKRSFAVSKTSSLNRRKFARNNSSRIKIGTCLIQTKWVLKYTPKELS